MRRPALLAGAALAVAAPDGLAAQAARRDSARVDSARTQRLGAVTVTASVSGRGEARAAAGIDSVRLRLAVPGTSALKVIEQLPGVNVQSVDGFGMYEWSNRITIRGFQTQQIGQTMDGIPLGDMSYGNFNGLGIGRAVDPSNLQGATVAQGTGSLGTASANNLGGVVQYATGDPSNRRGLLVQQMGGEAAARRTTLRFDSGLDTFGAGNAFRSYLSYARFDTDKWKGGGDRYSSFPGERSLLFGQGGFIGRAGEQWQDQLNAKADLLVGSLKLTGFYNYAQRKESDFMDLSLPIFSAAIPAPAGFAFGPDFDYLGSWAQARQLAELSQQRYNPLTDAAYYQSAQGARQDHLAYLKAELRLGERVRVELQPYLHANRGGGDWHAPAYGAAWSPDPIHFRQTQYVGDRGGLLGRLAATFATGGVSHQLEAGTWLEGNETRIRRPRWRLQNYATGPAVDFSRPIRLDFDRTGDIGTTLLYAQNTSRLLDGRLAVSYGAKWLRVSADFVNNGNTPTDGIVAPVFPDAARPSLSVPTDGGLLPQFGAVFKATAREEVFVNWSENVNQFPYSPGGGVFNASPATFDFFRQTVRPERATTLEAGVRTRRGPVEAGLTGYTIDYRNRLLGIALCPPTVTCATGFGNVGTVDSRGVEGVLASDLVAGLRGFVSASYNVSTYGGNYRANQNDPTSEVQTRGRDVIDAPRRLANVGLTYERGRVLSTVTWRFVDRRAFTFTNDGVDAGGRVIPDAGFAPSYAVTDLSARLNLFRWRGTRGVDLQLNAINLFDERYIGTIGTNGFTANDQNYATLLTGAPRLVFLTLSTRL